MSNTSTVTPYSASSSSSDSGGVGARIAAACIVGALVGAVSLARWLAEESPEDREALKRLKDERRRELLTTASRASFKSESKEQALGITSVDLQLRNATSLVRTAEKLGYRIESIGDRGSTSVSADAPILLRRASGERLAIARNESGRLAIHTHGGRDRVQSLVRQHTVDRTMEHLAAKGMRVQSARLANGEVQILAHEQGLGKRGGAAEIKTQVYKDGTLMVDVDKVRGNRCEEIVRDLAEAVGGEVSNTSKKDSYFQLPGEPTKTRVKV